MAETILRISALSTPQPPEKPQSSGATTDSHRTNPSPHRVHDSSGRPSTMPEPDVTSELRSNRRKRKSEVSGAEVHEWSKRVELSLTRPSYVLGIGAKTLRVEHRCRLEFLLQQLVRQQKWTEASGVLSVYLTATCKDRSVEHNRFKYSVLIELLDHIDKDRILNVKKLREIYDVWTRRIGSDKSGSSEVHRDRLAVNLELVLLFLMQGEVDRARDASLSITEQKDFARDPMANMVLGLVFYQLWYLGIPKELQRVDMEQLVTPPQSLDENFGSLAENTKDNAAYSGDDGSCNISSSSVRKSKRLSRNYQDNGSNEIAVKLEYSEEYQPQSNAQAQGFYANSTESEASVLNNDEPLRYVSALSNLNGLDPWLLPIQLPQNIEDFEGLTQLQRQILNNHYKDALKYLQIAADLSPLSSDALLPLIQLLLIGGQHSKAFDVLEKLCLNPDSPFPIRVQAALLEHFDRQNYAKRVSCYENLLKIDPAFSYSISRLITMHHNGDYNTESLLETIALHLDYADGDTWSEFASCFLNLAQGEGDCESVCMDGEGGEGTRHYRPVTPKMFMKPNSAKTWKDRCRCWLTNHFSCTLLNSEIKAGNLQLASRKAACAAYLYGLGFEYVAKVHSALTERGDGDILSFLTMHMEYSAKLHSMYPIN